MSVQSLGGVGFYCTARPALTTSSRKFRRTLGLSNSYLQPRLHICQSVRPARRSASTCRAGPSDVLLLDFDGVIVDSEPEVTAGCIESAKALWQSELADLDDSRTQAVKQSMRILRPAMNSTWEFLVGVRLLAGDPDSAHDLAKDWTAKCRQAVADWGTTEQDIESHSQKFRKQRVAGDEGAFIRNNQLYDGVKDAVSQCQYPWYVITSRAKDRTLKLLKGLLEQDWPEDTPRLYAGLSPPNEKKIAAISDIASRPLVTENKARLHFVDDRFETVKAVLEANDLQSLKLKVYLADWGYNTEDERNEAQHLKGLQTINLKQFAELMQWGVVMGVDDGCGDDN